MPPLYVLVHETISISDTTPTEVKLSVGSKEHRFKLSSAAAAFTWSTTSAGAATGQPFAAGGALEIDGPIARTSVWLHQTSGGPLVIHHSFLQPEVR